MTLRNLVTCLFLASLISSAILIVNHQQIKTRAAEYFAETLFICPENLSTAQKATQDRLLIETYIDTTDEVTTEKLLQKRRSLLQKKNCTGTLIHYK